MVIFFFVHPHKPKERPLTFDPCMSPRQAGVSVPEEGRRLQCQGQVPEGPHRHRRGERQRRHRHPVSPEGTPFINRGDPLKGQMTQSNSIDM